ncbi:deaminase domain-containing protein [Nocardiopsis suaedae]|uniref:Deaminase domain-containing protein n=1 Tax=Nocardiopsis suaedae TaxID=3018444 RepID=A0ABT4TV10_9ACTN|nr:deaminase domain-containing protein [Nocardiopsis suaedae]MDA2808546.1 deaminase domain-containing protein [Nocardiopsis suaedae]
MLLRIHDPDRGASFAEYSAVIVVCGAIIASLVGVGMTDTGQEVRTGIENAYEQAFGGEGMGNEGDPQTVSGSDGDDGASGDDSGGDGGDDKSVLDHVGGFFSGLGSGIADDVTGIGDIFTQNPVDTFTDAVNGIKEDPLSLILSPETRDAWNNGDYGEALGGGAWDIGSWFIPGPGWASKLGKLGRLGGRADGPDAPDSNGNSNGNGSDNDGNDNDGDKPDDDQQADGDHDGDGNPGITCSSFPAGTSVLLSDGSSAPIEQLGVGDQVWAFDPLTGEEGAQQITGARSSSGPKTLVDIAVEDRDGMVDTVTATDEHPFWMPAEAVWSPAGEVEPGDSFRMAEGSWATAQNVESRDVAGREVYNLSVEGVHTYYVGTRAGFILVHNANCYAGDAAGTGRIRSDKQVGKKRNIAVVDYDIEGMGNGQLVGVSGRKNSPPGTSPNIPDDAPRQFDPEGGDGHQAPHDSEAKALEELARDLEPDATGTVEIYTERPPCTSCQSVVDQFIEQYPGVEVRVTWGQDSRVYRDTSSDYTDPDSSRYSDSDWYEDQLPDYMKPNESDD